MVDQPEKDTAQVETDQIGNELDNMVLFANNTRKPFARAWYNNNFFDDGHHLRSISRTTGRIVDLSNRASLYSPRRAIPKASRQIRGMANLLLSQDYVPQVRPEKVTSVNYPEEEEFAQVQKDAKLVAKRAGHWLTEEWDNQDLDIKMVEMLLLTMKNFISYLQVWPDPIEETIRTQVYDAFDIYLMSNLNSIYDSPFMIKIVPNLIRKMKANEYFDEIQLKKISPDSRYASDEIKEAYLTSKYGKAGAGGDSSATLLQKEAFLKEYIGEKNLPRIRGQKEDKEKAIPSGAEVLKDKKKGDPIIRQVFAGGKVWLRDIYTTLPDYPFVDLRLEPGPIYGVSQIERFIPANKSLDSVISRIERWIHTMTVGVWTQREGENFQLSNVAGGLLAKYKSVPPQQMQMSSITSAPFMMADILTALIEEQGVTTSALGKLPKGVKAGIAIESLKASEFANLFIAIKQIKKTIQTISEKMFDIADNHFINKKTILRLEKGEPDYFDIIGQSGIDARKNIDEADKLDGVIPIKKEYKVDIEIQAGLGYTEEGRKARMMELANFFIVMAKEGLITPQVVKVMIEQLMETFKFGPAEDMMEALDEPAGMDDEQLSKLKLAVIEVLKDAKQAGLFDPDEEKHLAITKAGSIQALSDAKKAGLWEEKPQEEAQEVERIEKVETGKDGRKETTQIKTKRKRG